VQLLVCLVDPRSGLATDAGPPVRIGEEAVAARVVDAAHLDPIGAAPPSALAASRIVPWLRLGGDAAANVEDAHLWIARWEHDPRRVEEAGRVWIATADAPLCERGIARLGAGRKPIGWILACGSDDPNPPPTGASARVALSRLDLQGGNASATRGAKGGWTRARRRAVFRLTAAPDDPPTLSTLEIPAPNADDSRAEEGSTPLREEVETWFAFARARQEWLGSADAPFAWLDSPVGALPADPAIAAEPGAGRLHPLGVIASSPRPLAGSPSRAVMASPPGAFETVADLRAQWARGQPAWLLDQCSGGPDPQPPARVTVVVPAYDHQSFIEEALASVLVQEVDGLELVVVDDESSDSTFDVAAAFLAGQARVPWRLIRRRNGNAFTAINTGLALASGEYLAVLNSDDAYRPGRLSTIVGAMRAQASAFGFSRVRFVDDSGVPVEDTDSYAGGLAAKFESLRGGAALLEALLTTNVTISTGNHVLRRDVLDAVGGYAPLRLNHDWHFALSASFHTPLTYVDEPLYAYRLHGANTIAGKVIEGSIEAHWLQREFLSRLDRHPLAATSAIGALVRSARLAGLGALLPVSMRREA
jgi:glycosyltransferase involved in cell wall biosynthesis